MAYPKCPFLRRTSRSRRSSPCRWRTSRRPVETQCQRLFNGHARLTHHRWRSKRRRSVIVPPRHLARRHSVPPEVQLPVEASPCLVGCSDVLEGLVAYHIDDWTHHRSPVQDDSGKKRLKPSFGALRGREGKALSLSYRS